MDMTPQQAAKLTEKLIAELTAKVESLTAEKEAVEGECMHYCTGDMIDHFCGTRAVMGTQSTTDWVEVTCAKCLASSLAQAREEIETLKSKIVELESTWIARMNDNISRAHTELKNQLTAALAERDEARERVKELERSHDFDAKRLRVLARVAGCEEGVPDDATAVACAGTVLGMIRRNVEEIVKERDRLAAQNERLLNQNRKVWAILNGAGLCGSTQEEIEEQLLHYANVDARIDAIAEEAAAQLDTAWQQGAEAFREDVIIETVAAMHGFSNRCTATKALNNLTSRIRALPVPERKEG